LFSLALCKISGLKIVWTIHNAESHTRPGSFFEKLVTRILLFFADKVTALNNHIRKVMEERYDFNNIFLLRQGLYEGCYANTITREQARQKLGLEKNDFVLLFLGKVEEYKGIDIAIEALDLVADDSVKLLIAGRINRSLPYGAHVIELAAKNKNIIVHNNFIPDDDVQIYFKAADYSIYPYRRIDNSGVLFLTLTFSVPTIMRGAGGITEIFDLNPKAAILIDHADKHEIARAIKKARTTRVDSSEFAVFNQELSWKNLEKEITDCFNSL
jgi:glycosyltransferase involved in cell wall biosynthesis